MKTKIFLFALCALLASPQVNAQTNVSFGIKAELNWPKVALDDSHNIFNSTTITSGLGIGGFAKIDFGEYFAIQPELFLLCQSFPETKYIYMDQDLHTTRNETISHGAWGIEIPVYAVGQLPLKNGDRIYLGFGPYYGLSFGSEHIVNNDTEKNAIHREDFGLAIMGGYEFPFGLQINVGYKYQLTHRHVNYKHTTINGAISVGAGYRF